MSLRNRLLGLAALLFAVAPIWMPDGPARAGDVTYPMLNNQTTVQDTDLLAVWRASGPLAKANASVLAAYLQAKFNADYLQIGNNLSDLGNLTTARSNLGLGTAATQNTGTSGANVCLMNANCTWSGTEAFSAAVTFGLTTVHTGLATFNGGITDNGSLTVSGATTLTGGVTGNLTTTGNIVADGGQLGAAASAGSNRGMFLYTGGNLRWIVAADSSAETGSNAGSNLGASRYSDAGAYIDTPWSVNRATGLYTIYDGLTVFGALTLPVASIINADLDAVATAGTCTASLTNACGFTLNAQGRITGTNSASPHPAISSSTTGALETNDGSTVKWAQRASLYITNCSSFGCTTSGATNANFSRAGTGHYTVTFTNAFPNTNFTLVCLVGQSGAGNWFCQEDTGTSRSTTSVSIYVTNNNGTAQDNAGSINVLVLAN